MKVPKFAYYISLLITTIVATLFYTIAPLLIAMAAVVCLGLSGIWIGPIAFVIYVFMLEWQKAKAALRLFGIRTEDDEDE